MKELEEIKKRFKLCQDWEANARNNYDNDVRFANGDPYNMYQWPDGIVSDRKQVNRPCITTNIVRQHNLAIINEALQARPAIKYRAVDAGADKAAADVWGDIARFIEYDSSFKDVIGRAVTTLVEGGVGAWRVVTEYESAETFDQVVKILPINDPRAVYVDPDAQQADKRDMRFAFVFNDMAKEEFDKKFPQYKDLPDATFLDENLTWVLPEHVRVAEYFCVKQKADELLLIEHEGEQFTILRSMLGRDAARIVKAEDAINSRKVLVPMVEWKLIAGDKIIETKEWPGTTIPIVLLVAEETVIDGLMDRKGHTRAMLDSQRMYNYWNSAAVEFVALQTKTPWVAPVEAISGFEDEWNNANVENLAFLPYKSLDEDGRQIPPPQRPNPPAQAAGYVQGAQMARAEMMMASGQYENALGEQGNERTGRAIMNRQKQGDRATYHYTDAVARGIVYTGEIIKQIVPHIYDTRRVLQLMGEDGADYEVMIDPGAKQAYQKRVIQATGKAELVFNPNIGRFAVYADAGPGYSTKRQEAWDSFNAILTQSPQLTGVIGDLMMLAGDFPNSEEAATRLRRLVPKEALGEGPSPAEQQLQAQLQQLQQTIAALTEENATLRIASRSKDEQNINDAYKSQTDRFKVLADHMQMPPEVLLGTLIELMKDAAGTAQRQQVAESVPSVLPPSSQVPSAQIAQEASLPGQMDPRIAEMLKPNMLLGGRPQQ